MYLFVFEKMCFLFYFPSSNHVQELNLPFNYCCGIKTHLKVKGH